MDSVRLKKLVGDPLAEGLIHVSTNQPADSVDCLGKWLLNWAKMQEDAVVAKAKAAEVDAAYAVEVQAKKEQDDKNAALQAQADIEQQRRDELSKLLETSIDLDELTQKVLAQLGPDLGANSYIGALGPGVDEEGNPNPETKSCEYILADEKNQLMVGQTLSGDEGATWDVFKIPEEENPEVDAEGNPIPPKPPAFLHIPNVIRDYHIDPETGKPNRALGQRMKFFSYPQLGSYLCVPCIYQSSLHAGAPDTPEVNEETGEAVDFTIRKELILCLDTIGLRKGVPFSDAQIAYVVELAAKLGAGLTRAEAALYQLDISMRPSEEQLAAAAEAEEALLAAAGGVDIEAELEKKKGEGMSEAELKALEAALRMKEAHSKVLALKQKITELERYRVPPKPEAMAVLEGILYLLKYTKKDLGGKTIDWQKTRRLFDSEFFNRLQAYDPKAKSKSQPYQKVGAVKALLEGKDLDALNKLSAAYGALYTWGTSAIAAKEIEIERREAEEENK